MYIEYKTKHGKQVPIKYMIDWETVEVYSTPDKRVKLVFQTEGEPNTIIKMTTEAASQIIDGITKAVLDNMEGEEYEYKYTPEEE